ncbi:hypothetical protein [Moritella sp. F3]|uniref:hypothetical protein n=1 Tax=Moritella sp. F3 TaxID=2718882 RepID=UPI0018E18020|nr:hypothetical protein [Moritella sp. F3]GIC77687.1 hypothetical protein FMO001_24140 [Moritella sp. F1]GIC82100.1 hypothetical protein FMO003_23810 [Moritella sp. F3]
MSTTTIKSNDEYLIDSNHCHNKDCNSTDIDGGKAQIDARIAWQEVSCNVCNMEWRDEYQLTNFVVTGNPKTK